MAFRNSLRCMFLVLKYFKDNSVRRIDHMINKNIYDITLIMYVSQCIGSSRPRDAVNFMRLYICLVHYEKTILKLRNILPAIELWS